MPSELCGRHMVATAQFRWQGANRSRSSPGAAKPSAASAMNPGEVGAEFGVRWWHATGSPQSLWLPEVFGRNLQVFVPLEEIFRTVLGSL